MSFPIGLIFLFTVTDSNNYCRQGSSLWTRLPEMSTPNPNPRWRDSDPWPRGSFHVENYVQMMLATQELSKLDVPQQCPPHLAHNSTRNLLNIYVDCGILLCLLFSEGMSLMAGHSGHGWLHTLTGSIHHWTSWSSYTVTEVSLTQSCL